ncbi:MAG: serine/threonine protein kinase, partial [Gemmataceae bacterium]
MSIRFDANAEPIPGYRLLDRLGSGGFGEVWRCEAPGGIFKAVKIIHGDLRSQDNDLVRYAEQELKALKRVKTVRHPYLLSIDRYDIVEGRLLIVMELADCNLWDRFRECRLKGLPGIPRDELMMYMAESAEVLDLMNDQFQLQHLDIKPQNLFMLHKHVKVADFGQVKDLEGHMASVTGGITPVYAAPETFDGFVSRFCDQYSLACVFQELLTGQRPFDGTSMQQLLMQHLQMPPNLAPCGPADRVVLERALAKKPDDRFPNVMSMVDALRSGRTKVHSPGTPETAPRPSQDAVPTRMHSIVPTETLKSPSQSDVILAPPGTTGSSVVMSGMDSGMGVPETPVPPVFDTQPPRPAPPERSGTGPIRPTIVIGLGLTGLRVVQHLRSHVLNTYGPADAIPTLRLLYIDTDPDTLNAAMTSRPEDPLPALRSEEVFPAKLNRATHYLKPRLNGRTLVEGWFDPQLLYKLPRVPVTMG